MTSVQSIPKIHVSNLIDAKLNWVHLTNLECPIGVKEVVTFKADLSQKYLEKDFQRISKAGATFYRARIDIYFEPDEKWLNVKLALQGEVIRRCTMI
jgi:hypothetical protein